MGRIVQPFSHYEIHRCVEVQAYTDQNGYVEQVDTDEELAALRANLMRPAADDLVPFWTLYGRYDNTKGEFGGLEAIADRDTWEDAAALLESILGRSLGELGSDEPWPAR